MFAKKFIDRNGQRATLIGPRVNRFGFAYYLHETTDPVDADTAKALGPGDHFRETLVEHHHSGQAMCPANQAYDSADFVRTEARQAKRKTS